MEFHNKIIFKCEIHIYKFFTYFHRYLIQYVHLVKKLGHHIHFAT
jgi:hypothetical protein